MVKAGLISLFNSMNSIKKNEEFLSIVALKFLISLNFLGFRTAKQIVDMERFRVPDHPYD